MTLERVSPGGLDPLRDEAWGWSIITPEQVRSDCMAEVERGLCVAPAQFDASTSVGRQRLSSLSQLLCEEAHAAADAGDAVRVAIYRDVARQLPVFAEPALAATAFAAMRLPGEHEQSQPALLALRGRLEAERSRGLASLAEHRAKMPQEPYPEQDAPLLAAVLNECIRGDIEPDFWIDDFAISPEQRWRWQLCYHALRYQLSDEDPHLASQLEAVAGQLLEFSDEFVFSEMFKALDVVKDSELRERLLARYMESAEDMAATPELYRRRISVGVLLAADPVFIADPRVENIGEQIQDVSTAMHDAGAYDYFLARERLRWEMSYDISMHGTAESFVDKLDVRIGHMFAMSDELAAASRAAEQPFAVEDPMFLREHYVRDGAVLFAANGNFAEAGKLLAHIANPGILHKALKHCLARATEDEQVDQLAANLSAAEESPAVQTHLVLHKARLRDDVPVLFTIGTALANVPVHAPEFVMGYNPADDPAAGDLQDLKMLQELYLWDIYRSIAEAAPQQGIAFGRHVLNQLRQARIPQAGIRHWTEALVAAGDKEEAANAFQYILHTSSPAERFIDMWQLGRAITRAS